MSIEAPQTCFPDGDLQFVESDNLQADNASPLSTDQHL